MLNSNMSFYNQDSYQNLKHFLLEQSSKELNSQIVTLPGLGISFHLRMFLKKYLSSWSTYKSLPNSQPLKKYNFIDLDLARKAGNISYVDEIFHQLDLNQKACLVINNPAIFSSLAYKQADFPKKIYSTYYFGSYNLHDTASLCKDLNPKLKTDDIDKIFLQSGGIARLVKFLAQNYYLLDIENEETIISRPDLSQLLSILLESISTSPAPIVESLNITRNGKYQSSILQAFFKKQTNIQIDISPDLTFSENSIENLSKLTKSEAAFLTYLLSTRSLTNREQIGDILWGQGTYDKFSDQAINQFISRLNKKLHFYKLKNVPKVGYKLEPKK